jgi:DNA-binding MarR family transcriptional regulator
MKKKRTGREPALIDMSDILLLSFLYSFNGTNLEPTISEIQNFTNLSPSNLINHLNKLRPLLQERKDKHKKFISLNELGKGFYEIIKEGWSEESEGKTKIVIQLPKGTQSEGEVYYYEP